MCDIQMIVRKIIQMSHYLSNTNSDSVVTESVSVSASDSVSDSVSDSGSLGSVSMSILEPKKGMVLIAVKANPGPTSNLNSSVI